DVTLHYTSHVIRDHPTSSSLPTRRSTDLPETRDSPLSPRGRHVLRERCGSTTPQRSRDAEFACRRHRRGFLRSRRLGLACKEGRSEEHTSELQSRGHIVCRLLLEKKKIFP